MPHHGEETLGGARARCLQVPAARGPLSDGVFQALTVAPEQEPSLPVLARDADPLGEDVQVTLYVCYELHYSAIAGVDERWEWAPSLLRLRGDLERSFERAISELVPAASAWERSSVGRALQELVCNESGPPLSRYLETRGERRQMLEHVIHRSAYQLKEADPHSWAIPRLTGSPKSALIEIQADEYGNGRAERMHSVLFERTMRGLGLDASYGAYIDRLPSVTLATVNLMSLLGLHRRLRGALVGHLAVFEMTSSLPNRRYGNALRRLGYGPEVTGFYDEHVEADAVHESIAAWDLAEALARSEPALAADVLFGARALLALDGRWAAHLLDAFRTGRSSLLAERPAVTAA